MPWWSWIVVWLPALVLAAAGPAAGQAPKPAGAAPPDVPVAILKDRFEPAEIRVKAGQPFVLVITNRDDVSHEFEVAALDIERRVRVGQTVRLPVSALKAGRYQVIDDDATPQLRGVLIAE